MFRAILFFTVFLFPIHSWAACSGPAGVEAQILYNSDHKTVQYCDGTSWIALGKADLTTALASLTDTNVSPTDGQVLTWDDANSEWVASDTTSGWQVPDDAAVCSGGGITGTIRYNSGKVQVCNNTDWVDVGGAESGGVWSLTGNNISNTNTGNVGVGEPSPTTKLHVAGKTTTDALVLKRQVGISAPTSTAGWNYSAGNLDFSGGNVGIGTTSPDSLLHIQNGGSFSGTVNSNNLGIFAKTTAANSVAVLSVVGGSSGISYLTLGGDGALSFDDGRVSYDASDQSLGLWTNNAQRVTIDSSGNVGIGTTTPSAKLDVNGSGNFTGVVSGLSNSIERSSCSSTGANVAACTAVCSSGYEVIGGGCEVSGGGTYNQIYANKPSGTSGWYCRTTVDWDHGATMGATGYAICLKQ